MSIKVEARQTPSTDRTKGASKPEPSDEWLERMDKAFLRRGKFGVNGNSSLGATFSTPRPVPGTVEAPAGIIAVEPKPYGKPVVITKGGVYANLNIESLDPSVPAITIKTSEKVTLVNCNLRGKGVLIEASFHHANLVVKDCRGTGLNPDVAGEAKGRFLNAEEFSNVVVEHNTLESTGGIYFRSYVGNPAAGDSVKIVRNLSHNIDGRRSDGHGGYLLDKPLCLQFLQFNDVKDIPGADIAWNQVVNDPFESAVEDNISMHLSRGTADSPILIHDNLIIGGYPPDPSKMGYSGGGIMLGDGASRTPEGAGGHQIAFGNTVLNTTNYGVAISGGHDNALRSNRVFATGRLPDGRAIPAMNVGVYVWNMHKDPATTFFNNNADDNVSGWTKSQGHFNAWWIPSAGIETVGNVGLNTLVDDQVIAEETRAWLERAKRQGAAAGAR